MATTKANRRGCLACESSRYAIRTKGELTVVERCAECAGRCARCGDEGYVVTQDARGYDLLVPCECRKLTARLERFNAARIPARYSHCQLAYYDPATDSQRAALQRVHRHIEAYRPNGRGLLLQGPVGTGKTHLLVAVLRALTLERGVAARFVEFTHMLSDIKEGFSQGRNEAEVLAPVSRVPVLGIDELGKGLTTDWQLSVLDEVISRRYNNGLTTYFTTNLVTGDLREAPREPVTAQSGELRRSLEAVQLVDRVGERSFSRLHEMCEVVEVRGPDYRKR
jgi:DNA replication protein DnaC